MKRNSFVKALLGWPLLSGPLARLFQSEEGQPEYLLNKFYVAGFQYYEGPAVIKGINEGEWLQLRVVPDNEHDRFAIKILQNGTILGHVPRTDNKHISRLLQQNVSLFCKVTEVNSGKETWEMLKVEVWL